MNARITRNHSKPCTWWPPPQSQKAAYASVVHGSRKKPSSGTIQLSNARLSTLLKIHTKNSARRGEISAKSARRQPTAPVSPVGTCKARAGHRECALGCPVVIGRHDPKEL